MCLEEAILKDPWSDKSGSFHRHITGRRQHEFSIAFLLWEVGDIYQWKNEFCWLRSGIKVCRVCILKTFVTLRQDIYAIFVGNLSVE